MPGLRSEFQKRRSALSGYLHELLAVIALHSTLAIGVAFVTAMAEALLVMGLFVPSTILLVGIGDLVGLGQLPLWPVCVATFLGAVAGDQLSYWIGYAFADPISRAMSNSRYREAWAAGERYFVRHGAKSVVIGRFVPGLKAVVPVVAGTMGMGIARFSALNAASAAAWAALHLLPGISAGVLLARLGILPDPSTIALSLGAIGLLSMTWMAAAAGRATIAGRAAARRAKARAAGQRR